MLRIDCGAPEETLEEISWDEFFQIFDENELAFPYQDRTEAAIPAASTVCQSCLTTIGYPLAVQCLWQHRPSVGCRTPRRPRRRVFVVPFLSMMTVSEQSRC